MKASVSIHRIMSSDPEARPIRIEVEDESSKVKFLTLSLSLSDFAEAITGRGYVDAEMEVRGLDLIGTRREHKQEIVYVEGHNYGPDIAERVRRALAPEEIDGWRGRASDAVNSHRIVERLPEGYRVRVSFDRHVREEVS